MRLVFLSGLAALLGCTPPAHPGSPGPCPPSTRAHQGGNAGARVLSCQLPDATLHGPWQFVSDESWVAGRYDHGLPDGRFTQRTLDGRVLGHYDIHRGDGVELRWYASGALESEVTLRRGLRDGQRVVYRPDDIVTRIEDWHDGTLVRATGEPEHPGLEASGPGGAASGPCAAGASGCPDACVARGREVSIARVAPVVDGASLTLDLERYEIGAEVAPGDAVPLHVEAPLRFRATAPRGDVVLLTRGLSRLRDDGIFVRVAPSHRVDARPGHAGVEASIELAPGASLRWPLRCEQLTLEGTPNPDHSLEPVRGDGTLWKAATPSLAVSTRPATPGEWRLEGSPTVVFSRLERHGGWAHVVWQSWDWSALSGWVREADLEPGHAPPEHSESHHIPDREDCTLAPGARQVTLRVGTALHARPQGPRWAEVTRELSAIVASSADPDWPTVTALAGVHRSDDPGGCRALEHTFVRASALW